jgi:hypothetical protein
LYAFLSRACCLIVIFRKSWATQEHTVVTKLQINNLRNLRQVDNLKEAHLHCLYIHIFVYL